jgi:hypothetical protein
MPTAHDLPISTAPANLPSTLNFLAPPPLIRTEECSAYDTLLARVSGAVKPSDVLEEIWVRDVVDLVWEVLRLRRLKAMVLDTCAHEGVRSILLQFDGINPIDMSRRWAAGDAGAAHEVALLLASAGLTMDAVMAQTLRVRVAEIERIDRLVMAAEARRNVALRELDRHRASFAANLRRVTREVEDVEDAEFAVVPPADVDEAARGAA